MLIRRQMIYTDSIRWPSDYSLDDGITQTMLSNMNCRLRLILWLNRWSNPEREYKCSWGALFHYLLDKLYSLNFYRGGIASRELIAAWASQYLEELVSKKMMKEETKDLNFSKSIVIISKYKEVYKEDFTLHKTKMVERAFDVPWEGFRLRGKIDRELTVNNLEDWLQEHKTKGKIEEGTLIDRLGINFQNLYYILARTIESKINYKGISYNIIRNPSSKPSTKKKESLLEFEERLAADIVKRPDHYFKRYRITFATANQSGELEKFSRNLKCRLNELYLLSKDKLPIYRNEFACEDPWPCPFLRACNSGNLVGYIQKEKLFEELSYEE